MNTTRSSRLTTAGQIVGGIGVTLAGLATLFYGFLILVGLGFAEQDGGVSAWVHLALWSWLLGMLGSLAAGGLGTVWLHQHGERGWRLLAAGAAAPFVLGLIVDLWVHGAPTPLTVGIWLPFSPLALAALLGRAAHATGDRVDRPAGA